MMSLAAECAIDNAGNVSLKSWKCRHHQPALRAVRGLTYYALNAIAASRGHAIRRNDTENSVLTL